MKSTLLEKYNVAGPRYTSYPTVPFWDTQSFSTSEWENRLSLGLEESQGSVSIYIHLPYCESLCTYCGCNTRITKNHQVEDRYIEALLYEWKMYLEVLPQKPLIEAIHLGGGTPTFFAPENLEKLISGILQNSNIAHQPELSFEGHPGNTKRSHLKILADQGFDRVSFGIQDFDDEIQRIINRKQSYEQVAGVVRDARELGYRSINFDLIYGLPGQTQATITDTIEKTMKLMPDRIAFYSYAHVPKLKPAQRSYESLLPGPELKADIYKVGKDLLKHGGYVEIGMDHFALTNDPLYRSFVSGTIHRNFMGYTVKPSKLLIGLGASSIGDVWSAFNQNEKNVERYLELVEGGNLPIVKGHLHSAEDLILREKILDLICRFETSFTQTEWEMVSGLINNDLLSELACDQLISFSDDTLVIAETGKPFVRNVCMAFDAHLRNQAEKKATFSQTV